MLLHLDLDAEADEKSATASDVEAANLEASARLLASVRRICSLHPREEQELRNTGECIVRHFSPVYSVSEGDALIAQTEGLDEIPVKVVEIIQIKNRRNLRIQLVPV